jgi:hypothetical protein
MPVVIKQPNRSCGMMVFRSNTTVPVSCVFFSGAGHATRAVRTALHMRLIETEPLKIGVCSGDVYFGSVGHPDYARPDVIGETVSIALLAMDWAVEHTKTGVVVTASTMEAMDNTVTAGPYTDVHLSGISHAVSLIEVS